MAIQQTPANTNPRMSHSLQYANEWFLRFGEATPIDGDLIARKRDLIAGQEDDTLLFLTDY